jgi:hypothetical protein
MSGAHRITQLLLRAILSSTCMTGSGCSTLLDGGVDWGIDEAMMRLIEDKHVPGAIIVG